MIYLSLPTLAYTTSQNQFLNMLCQLRAKRAAVSGGPINESAIFWEILIQLIEEGHVIPVVGRDLLVLRPAELPGVGRVKMLLVRGQGQEERVLGPGLPEGEQR